MKIGPLLDRIQAQALGVDRKSARDLDAKHGVDASPNALPSAPDWIVSAVAAVPKDAPDRRRRALRAYLQASLVRELGIRDPAALACQELVDRVLEAMEDRDELRAAMERAADVLLERVRGNGT